MPVIAVEKRASETLTLRFSTDFVLRRMDALVRPLAVPQPRTDEGVHPTAVHSHSIVLGGFELMS